MFLRSKPCSFEMCRYRVSSHLHQLGPLMDGGCQEVGEEISVGLAKVCLGASRVEDFGG